MKVRDGGVVVAQRLQGSTISRLLQAIGVAATLSAATAVADGSRYAWTAAETRDHIQVFTSEVASHSYDAVRAKAVITAPAARVIAMLQQFERYSSWYHRVSEVRIVRQPKAMPEIGIGSDGSLLHVPDTGPWILFLRQHTPPLDDRWALLRCGLRAGPRGTLLIEFNSLQRAFAEPKDAVRMDLRGYWELRSIGPSHTEVTFMLDVDPNTVVPALFVDAELRDVVVITLQNLRKSLDPRARNDARSSAAKVQD